MKELYLANKEWENFQFPIEISNLSCEKNNYDLNPNCIIKVWRDEDFQLQASISGYVLKPQKFEDKFEDGGNFIITDTINGNDTTSRYIKYILEGCFIVNFSFKGIVYSDLGVPFTAKLHVDSLTSVNTLSDSSQKATVVFDWFLCNQSTVHFPRSTKREAITTFLKQRVGFEEETDQARHATSQGSLDYFKIDQPDLNCIVASVPKGFGPSWAKCISIEYHSKWGIVTEDSKKDAIKNLVGFLFGSQLIYIGSVTFSSHDVVSRKAVSPMGSGTRYYCSKSGLQPVKLNRQYEWGNIEWLINKLLPSYLQQMECLDLNGLVWKYFEGVEAAVGVNLPILSSAIESLANNYLNENDVSLSYMPMKEYMKLIGDDINSIKNKLKDIAEFQKIINKIEAAWNRGPNEKLEMFFKKIELPISKTERSALKARNSMAHGGANYKTMDEVKPLIITTKVYETLFHRIFLKVLDYDGYYIDYSLPKQPSKKISNPTGPKEA